MKNFNKDKLKQKITDSGMKVKFIAEKLNISRFTLTSYLMGRRNPPKETLVKITRMIKCKLGDIHDVR